MITELFLRMLIAAQGIGAPSQDDDGQTLAEYSLIISAIAVAAVLTGVIVFRGALTDAWNSAADCLNALSPC
jgi:Flp pilus assembly pilin Flp